MTDSTVETSPRLKARIAGVLYVIIIVLAVFAPFPVAPSGLMRSDLAATAVKILASESLYSLGGAAELIVYACDIGVALIFYELLKPVSRSLAQLAVFFRLTFVAIASANVLNHFVPLLQSSSSLSGQIWNSESLGGNLERHGTPVFESKISLRLHREMNRIWLASPFSRVLFLADFYADMLDIQRA